VKKQCEKRETGRIDPLSGGGWTPLYRQGAASAGSVLPRRHACATCGNGTFVHIGALPFPR